MGLCDYTTLEKDVVVGFTGLGGSTRWQPSHRLVGRNWQNLIAEKIVNSGMAFL